MGILDDAIREHLELKRRQGAAEEEIARLESEAFGRATRPGDEEELPPPLEDSAAPAEASPAEREEPAAQTPTDAPRFVDPEAEGLFDAEAEENPAEENPAEEEPAARAEQASAEPAEPPAAEKPDPHAIAAEPTVEHDTLGSQEESSAQEESPSQELDLDIELDLDEQIEDVAELDLEEGEVEEIAADARAGAEASKAEPEPEGPDKAPRLDTREAEEAPAAEQPIESLDTVEHHFEDALDEAEVVEDSEDDLTLEDDAGDDDLSTAAEDSEDDEDVLEETPEFLRDAPEDDELWFEQGEPKDFDF